MEIEVEATTGEMSNRLEEMRVPKDCEVEVSEDCTPKEILTKLDVVVPPDADPLNGVELAVALGVEDNCDVPVALNALAEIADETATVEIEVEAPTGEMRNRLEEMRVPNDCEADVSDDCTPRETLAELDVVENADVVNWVEPPIAVGIEDN